MSFGVTVPTSRIFVLCNVQIVYHYTYSTINQCPIYSPRFHHFLSFLYPSIHMELHKLLWGGFANEFHICLHLIKQISPYPSWFFENFWSEYFLRNGGPLNSWKVSNNFLFISLFFCSFIVKNWIIEMCDTGQVNNAGIGGTVVTDPDALRSRIASAEVRYHIQFLCWLKAIDCGCKFKEERIWNSNSHWGIFESWKGETFRLLRPHAVEFFFYLLLKGRWKSFLETRIMEENLVAYQKQFSSSLFMLE